MVQSDSITATIINDTKNWENSIYNTLMENIDKFENDEWHEILLVASKSLKVSVEDVLEQIEYRSSYDYFLEHDAEEQYNKMMNDDNTATGCDNYTVSSEQE